MRNRLFTWTAAAISLSTVLPLAACGDADSGASDIYCQEMMDDVLAWNLAHPGEPNDELRDFANVNGVLVGTGECEGFTTPIAESSAEAANDDQQISSGPQSSGLGVGPYTLHLTTPDGWEYDVTLEWSPEPITARADISNSPPGKAQLHLTADMVDYSYTGTLEGRNAPPLEIVDIRYVWSEQGPDRFDEADVCRRRTDAELGLAVGDEMAVWCDTLAFDGGDLDRTAVAASYADWLASTVEGPEADVYGWADYFAAHPSPDFVTVMFAGPCTVAVDASGGASLLTGDSVYSPIRSAIEGCAASGEVGPAALNQ